MLLLLWILSILLHLPPPHFSFSFLFFKTIPALVSSKQSHFSHSPKIFTKNNLLTSAWATVEHSNMNTICLSFMLRWPFMCFQLYISNSLSGFVPLKWKILKIYLKDLDSNTSFLFASLMLNNSSLRRQESLNKGDNF